MIKFYGYYNKRLNGAKLDKLDKERIGLILRLAVAVKGRRPTGVIRKELSSINGQMILLE